MHPSGIATYYSRVDILPSIQYLVAERSMSLLKQEVTLEEADAYPVGIAATAAPHGFAPRGARFGYSTEMRNDVFLSGETKREAADPYEVVVDVTTVEGRYAISCWFLQYNSVVPPSIDLQY
jgi:hypothetical protein